MNTSLSLLSHRCCRKNYQIGLIETFPDIDQATPNHAKRTLLPHLYKFSNSNFKKSTSMEGTQISLLTRPNRTNQIINVIEIVKNVFYD
jgi:hypothetical protein